MSVSVCQHIKPSGARCASPAMRGQRYCYYHLGARQCLPLGRGMFADPSPGLPDLPPMPTFPIPFLEDAAAVQIGYMQALYGIISKRLDSKQARLVLTALNGARSNLKQMEACVTACANGISGMKAKIARVSKTARPAAPGHRSLARVSKPRDPGHPQA